MKLALLFACPKAACPHAGAALSLSTALSMVLSLCTLADAHAQASPEAQIPPGAIAQGLRLVTDAAHAVAPRAARVTVEAGRLDTRLTLAPCARAEAYLPAGLPAWGRVRVGLRCTDGVARWNVFLPVHVQVWAPGIVVTATLPTGARLEEGHLRRTEVDWSASGQPYETSEALVGRVLARALQAGQAVQAAHLQTRQWFAQGDTVRITATGPGFSIVSEGQALTAGQEGRPAKVQTENGRVLTGRAVGERRVEVSL